VLLVVPNQFDANYAAHAIESILEHLARNSAAADRAYPNWMVQASRVKRTDI